MTIEPSNSETTVEKLPKSLKGYIDGLYEGQLRGWALDTNDDSPVTIKVIVDNEVVATGTADKYRADLKEAGMGSGYHAFIVNLYNLDFRFSGKQVQLVCAKSLKQLNKSEFSLPDMELTASILSTQDHTLRIALRNLKGTAIGKQNLLVKSDESIIVKKNIDINDDFAEVLCPLPELVNDGKHKLLSIFVEGGAYALDHTMYKQEPFKAAWQDISDSFKQPNILSLPPQADSRYESLNFNLEEILSGKSTKTLDYVYQLHKILVDTEGAQKNYQPIALPAFDNPEFSIIISANSNFSSVYHTIASIIYAVNESSYEVVLVDNCSEKTLSQARDTIKNIVIPDNAHSLNVIEKLNAAADVTRGDFVLFLNSASEVHSFWLDELSCAINGDSAIGAVGSKIIDRQGRLKSAGGLVWQNGEAETVGSKCNASNPTYNYLREVDFVTSDALCIRKSVLGLVDKYDAAFKHSYCEEVDLAFKIKSQGYKVTYVPHSVVTCFEPKSLQVDSSTVDSQFIDDVNYYKKKWFNSYKNNGRSNALNLKFSIDRNAAQRILVIDYETPKPDKDAGSYAALQEIRMMQALGFKVIFVPESLAHSGNYTQKLQNMGVEVLYAPYYSNVYDVFDKRLAEVDAVYITRYAVASRYIDRIKESKDIPVIFNNADLHFLRELRAALHVKGVDEKSVNEALDTRTAELNVCKKVDAILCYNATEHAVITSHILEVNKLHITPWVLTEKPCGMSFNERKGIAFLGGYNHYPNVEAVDFLATKVMPLLAQAEPDIKLYVYGSNMPEYFKSYPAENIEFIGYVESLDDVYLEHKLFVSPLLSGAGIKGKVLEAMAYGMPTVLTSVAAEGTGLVNNLNAFFAENENEFVDAIIELYSNESLLEQFSQNQRILAQNNFSFSHGLRKFKQIFDSVGLYSALEG